MFFKTNNQINVAAQTAAQHFNQKEMERIIKINETQSYNGRFSGFIRTLKFFILPLLIVWSVITEGSFLWINYHGTTNNLYSAIFLTILWLLLIEGGKLFLGFRFIRFFSQGWIGDGWHYVVSLVFILPFFLLAYGGSAYLSIMGAPTIASYYSKTTTSLPLIDLQEIHARYDADVATLSQKQTEAHNTTWRGVITSDAVRLSSSIQKTIDLKEGQRQTELNMAIAENNRIRAEYDTGVADRGQWFQRFGGAGESLQLLILILFCIYERASYLELPKQQAQQEEQLETTVDNSGEAVEETDSSTLIDLPETGQRQAIGFKIGTTDPDAQFILPKYGASTIVKQVKEPPKVIVDLKYLKQRCKQTFKRSTTHITEEGRENNQRLFEHFTKELEKLGLTVKEIDGELTIE